MEHHPLTPMTDANILRVLRAQTPSKVGLLALEAVQAGEEAARSALEQLVAAGNRMIVADALDNTHLNTLARATQTFKLVTGGSGLALGLAGTGGAGSEAAALPPAGGAKLVLAGSASPATLEQIECARGQLPSRKLDVLALGKNFGAVLEGAKTWAEAHLGRTPVLIYGSGTPEQVRATQRVLGVQRSGTLLEAALAELARHLVARGVGQLIVAGGETAGAVLRALEVRTLRIGGEISPGVPWTVTELPTGNTLHLALKSGNFGPKDVFTSAWAAL